MAPWLLLTRRPLLPILVALVTLALVVNVCAPPVAGEWDHVEATESQAPGAADQSNGSSLAHCCDAKAVNGAPSCLHAADLLVALLTEREVVAGETPHGDQPLSAVLAARRVPDRSLFLLNASFLI